MSSSVAKEMPPQFLKKATLTAWLLQPSDCSSHWSFASESPHCSCNPVPRVTVWIIKRTDHYHVCRIKFLPKPQLRRDYLCMAGFILIFGGGGGVHEQPGINLERTFNGYLWLSSSRALAWPACLLWKTASVPFAASGNILIWGSN